LKIDESKSRIKEGGTSPPLSPKSPVIDDPPNLKSSNYSKFLRGNSQEFGRKARIESLPEGPRSGGTSPRKKSRQKKTPSADKSEKKYDSDEDLEIGSPEGSPQSKRSKLVHGDGDADLHTMMRNSGKKKSSFSSKYLGVPGRSEKVSSAKHVSSDLDGDICP